MDLLLRSLSLSRLPALLMLAGAPAAAFAVDAVRIELKEEALVAGRSVRLGDVAMISSSDRDTREAAEALRVDSAPRVGYVDRLSRRRIEQAVRSRLPLAGRKLEWGGTLAVNVRAAAHPADTEALAASAQRYLLEQLGRRFERVEAELALPLAGFELPEGEVAFRPRPLDPAWSGPRQSVWVDVFVDGAFYRSVAVPFRLRLWQPVQAARRDLPEGAMVSPADFDIRTEEVSGIAQRVLPASELRGVLRVRKSIAAGEPVMRGQLSEEGAIERGDVVRLVFAADGLLVETRAVAQQHAVPGQEVKVKPDYSSETVSGRVIAGGVVQAEAR